jgi:flagellar assembly factor FliW
MTIQTRHFGEIDIDESKIIVFEEGLPGFLELKRFVLFHDETEVVDQPPDDGSQAAIDPSSVFLWMQSLEDGDVSFVLINAFLFIPEYDPQIDPVELEALGSCATDSMIIRNIAVVTERLEDMTVNLCAPIVINPVTQLGKQAISANRSYHVRHHIVQEAREAI